MPPDYNRWNENEDTISLHLRCFPLPFMQAPPDYNRWNENEDMVSLHLRAIHLQLQQARRRLIDRQQCALLSEAVQFDAVELG